MTALDAMLKAIFTSQLLLLSSSADAATKRSWRYPRSSSGPEQAAGNQACGQGQGTCVEPSSWERSTSTTPHMQGYFELLLPILSHVLFLLLGFWCGRWTCKGNKQAPPPPDQHSSSSKGEGKEESNAPKIPSGQEQAREKGTCVLPKGGETAPLSPSSCGCEILNMEQPLQLTSATSASSTLLPQGRANLNSSPPKSPPCHTPCHPPPPSSSSHALPNTPGPLEQGALAGCITMHTPVEVQGAFKEASEEGQGCRPECSKDEEAQEQQQHPSHQQQQQYPSQQQQQQQLVGVLPKAHELSEHSSHSQLVGVLREGEQPGVTTLDVQASLIKELLLGLDQGASGTYKSSCVV